MALPKKNSKEVRPRHLSSWSEARGALGSHERDRYQLRLTSAGASIARLLALRAVNDGASLVAAAKLVLDEAAVAKLDLELGSADWCCHQNICRLEG